MTSQNLQFSVATPADAAAIQPLVRSAFRGEESRKGWTTEADLVSGERIDVKGIVDKITEPGSVVLIVKNDDGALVACCEVVKRSEDLGYLGLFAVEPRLQGGGLGRKVLAYVEEYSRKSLGVKTMEMYVIWTREELIAWYQRRGYRKTGETRPFPYTQLINDVALRDDLYFDILEKDLCAAAVVEVAA